MKTTLLRTLRPVAILALSLPAFAFAAATHTVNLTTPWKVGQIYVASVNSTYNADTVVMMGTQKLQEQSQKRSAKFEADGEALEVFAHGGLKKASFKVRSLRASIDGASESDMVPAGATVIAEVSGPQKKKFTVNGKAATEQQETALNMVVTLDEEDHSDQILFGTNKPVAVGEKWPVNTRKIAETLGKELGTIASTKGEMRLDSIDGSGAGQVANVSGKVVFEGVQAALPPGLTAKPGSFVVELDGKIPASRSGSKRVENLVMKGELGGEAPGPDGGKVVLTVKLSAKNASTLTFP